MSTAEEHYQQAAALLAKVYTSDSTADEDPLTVATVAQVHAVLAVATVLNDILRPFLTRWHADFEAACSLDKAEQDLFRKQLEALRQDMLAYAELLVRIAE